MKTTSRKSRSSSRRRSAVSKSRKRRSSSSSASRNPIDTYLARVPEPARSTLRKLRSAIRSAVPRGTTEIISYGIPAFRHNGVLVWFAAFKDHCSFFPTASVIEAFKPALAAYKLSKGTIQFPVDKPLPASLVRRMVKARLASRSLSPSSPA
ncbi:MAG TPA: DUF1801 domain-containing protein [Candidatus Acidoferrum sp.]|nr:DUF1801 domain-containing protein [Candidatus Acidoferrum sp.]